MSLTLVLSLFYFIRVIEPDILRMRKNSCLNKHASSLTPKSYWWKISTLFWLVPGHQAPCSIPQSLSELVLDISLVLTHTEPMFPFGIPWKHKKTLWFSDFLKRITKGKISSIWVKSDFFSQSFDKLVLSDVLS